MDSPTLVRNARLVSATGWGAIARGVFVALAIQTVLLMFGLAIAGTVGDHVAEGGYGLWVVLAFLVSFAIGGAVAGMGSSAESRASGIAAGFMMWAVAVVVASAVGTLLATPQRADSSPLWTPFVATVLALVAAMIGGAVGASMRGRQLAADEEALLDTTDRIVSPIR